jgi:predicted membrane channel-forming protein YqfA (hemolysin III family)
MRAALDRLKLPGWTVPVVLLVLCILSFGLLIPSLGYYWDDWAKISVSRLFGLSGYWAYYAEDRPLSSWTHILLTPILGYRPIAWHIFVLLAAAAHFVAVASIL